MPEKKKLFIHIGYTKTGSKAIQESCFANRQLLASEGLLYPESTLSKKSHRVLYESMFPGGEQYLPQGWPTDHRHYFGLVRREIDESSCGNILLSCEGFFKFEDEFIEQLAQLTDGYDVRILVFFRRQDLWLESAFSQVIKANVHSKGMEFNEFVHLRAKQLDYYNLVKRWERYFGYGNVLPLLYGVSDPAFADGPINTLLKVVDFDMFNKVSKDLKTVGFVNVSPRKRSVLGLDLLKSDDMTRNDLKLVEDMLEAYGELHEPDKHYSFFSPEGLSGLNSQIAEGNEKLFREYFDKSNNLFEIPGFGDNTLEARAPSREELALILARLTLSIGRPQN